MEQIYVIHEHDARVAPLRDGFNEDGPPFEEWYPSCSAGEGRIMVALRAS